MIEEIIWAFHSFGSMSAALIFAPYAETQLRYEGQTWPETTEMCRAGHLRSRRSELVGCGVRLGHQSTCPSFSADIASKLPMANSENLRNRSILIAKGGRCYICLPGTWHVCPDVGAN